MKTILSWSSGKDSAWALHYQRLRSLACWSPSTRSSIALPCMASGDLWSKRRRRPPGYRFISCRSLIRCPNDAYEARTSASIEEAKALGIKAIAFGHLFHEDIARTGKAGWPVPGSRRTFRCGG